MVEKKCYSCHKRIDGDVVEFEDKIFCSSACKEDFENGGDEREHHFYRIETQGAEKKQEPHSCEIDLEEVKKRLASLNEGEEHECDL